MTVDRLKIDKSFITGMGKGRNSAIVEAIIKMARASGLDTTAEGVETNQQRDALKSLGCYHIQGFLMPRPVARPEVTALLLVFRLNTREGCLVAKLFVIERGEMIHGPQG